MIKPKVGFLIPRLGIVDRGVEIFVYELSKRLSGDFEIVVFVRITDKKNALIEDLKKKGVIVKKIYCINDDNNFIKAIYNFPFIRKMMDRYYVNPAGLAMLSFSIMCLPYIFREKPDILFPTNGVWGSIACRLYRVIKGIPFVCATLGGMEPLVARQKPSAYFSLFPTIAEWLRKNYKDLKVFYIPSSVDLRRYSPRGEKKDFNLPHPIYITVSAFVPEKQVDLTINAFSKVKKGSLLVVGNGPLKRELVQLANNLIDKKRFKFVEVNYNDLQKYYRFADIFCFSAPWEVGWSIVILEALASGLPVVVNNEENIRHLLGKNWPLLCNVRNADDYSKALIKATKVKVKSRELVKDYDWDKIVEKYRKAILLVINSKKS